MFFFEKIDFLVFLLTEKKYKNMSLDQIEKKPIISGENKMCTILWTQNKYGITILTKQNFRTHHIYPEFLIPLHTFLNLGSVWQLLNLCTVFWEPGLYGIPKDYQRNEQIKGSYLAEFASDLAPISKSWVKDCIQKIINKQPLNDHVFVNIILFDQTLLEQMINAIERHGLSFDENNKLYTVLDKKQ
jgi:hypothetical protein